jgi:hypothetical protein
VTPLSLASLADMIRYPTEAGMLALRVMPNDEIASRMPCTLLENPKTLTCHLGGIPEDAGTPERNFAL